LAEAVLPAWRLEVHETLGSTSDVCKQRAEMGEAAGLAILALEQTAGRGSRGRGWTGVSGNLALSILLRPAPALLAQVGLWPFVSALALHDALAGAVPDAGALRIKWPNDLTWSGRKLAGILIETGGAGDSPWVVIGFGANIHSAPQIEGRVLACLAEAGSSMDAVAIGRLLLMALEQRITQWSEAGFDAIRASWLKRAHPIGTHLAIKRGDDYIEGSFRGLTEHGHLLLGLENAEILRVSTGEILLLD